MKKFRVHPLFLPFALFLFASGKGLLFLYSVIAVSLHEYAHYAIAKSYGYGVKKLTLAPYGAVLSAECGLPDKAYFFTCSAGPACNLILALTTAAIWWAFPSTYAFTLDFFKANVAIGAFNLLPLFPLDGSRMLLSAVKNKLNCLKILRIVSLVFAGLCLALFVVSAFFKISYSLFLVAVTLIFGSLEEGKEEKYALLFKRAYYLKDCSRPLIKKELFVYTSLKIKRLLRELNNEAIYVVNVMDNNMKTKKVLREEDLEKMFFFDSDKTIGEFLLSIS